MKNLIPLVDLGQGVPTDQCVRGIAEKVDDTGLLWICEKMMPKSSLAAAPKPNRKRRGRPVSLVLDPKTWC
jgi:hypothetical protein